MNTLKIGDKVQPRGIELIPPFAWEVVDFYELNGRRIKTTIKHPVSGDLLSLEFISDSDKV